MKPTAIFLPCVALVAITAIVWIKLFIDRLREMRARNIEPQLLATRREAGDRLAHTGAADNLANLFELPVLFYVLCIALAASNLINAGFVYAAWAYVALRAVHSFIHCTYNQVTHRFAAYALSSVILFVMWAAFGVRLASL